MLKKLIALAFCCLTLNQAQGAFIKRSVDGLYEIKYDEIGVAEKDCEYGLREIDLRQGFYQLEARTMGTHFDLTNETRQETSKAYRELSPDGQVALIVHAFDTIEARPQKNLSSRTASRGEKIEEEITMSLYFGARHLKAKAQAEEALQDIEQALLHFVLQDAKLLADLHNNAEASIHYMREKSSAAASPEAPMEEVAAAAPQTAKRPSIRVLPPRREASSAPQIAVRVLAPRKPQQRRKRKRFSASLSVPMAPAAAAATASEHVFEKTSQREKGKPQKKQRRQLFVDVSAPKEGAAAAAAPSPLAWLGFRRTARSPRASYFISKDMEKTDTYYFKNDTVSFLHSIEIPRALRKEKLQSFYRLTPDERVKKITHAQKILRFSKSANPLHEILHYGLLYLKGQYQKTEENSSLEQIVEINEELPAIATPRNRFDLPADLHGELHEVLLLQILLVVGI
jgi:hypothetical protein